jgi:hypothetical protein
MNKKSKTVSGGVLPPRDLQEKSVAVIYTGGTVGSRGEKTPRLETSTSSSLREHLQASYPSFSYSHHHPIQILSENADPALWHLLAEEIKRIDKQENPDSFLLFHGTDTMTYTASALAFLLHDQALIEKPIVLTGSEYPLDHPLTDAPFNAREALRVGRGGVSISFRGTTFSATRTRKDPRAKNLFQEFPRSQSDHQEFLEDKEILEEGRGESFSRKDIKEVKPLWLRPAPGMDLPPLTGPVLLEMYPSWTAPDSWVDELLQSDYPLFLVTSHATPAQASYPSLARLEKKALRLSMLPETAWSKLLSYSGVAKTDAQKMPSLLSWMSQDIAGEFSA